MKINKNQALYRALPGCWTTYSDSEKSDYKYACQVLNWNTKQVNDINEKMIRDDIKRSIVSFKLANGAVSEELSEISIASLKFEEPAIVEGIPDIVCKISPATFYCQNCGAVINKIKATEAPLCPDCFAKGKKYKTNQLQMVYACECGFADGVKTFGKEKLYYHAREKENQFKFFTVNNSKREMKTLCPFCTNKTLLPKNATDSRLFYSHSGNLVNLYNKDYSNLLKTYGFDAELLVMAKWFEILDNDKFLNILKNPKPFFEYKSKDENDPDVLLFAKKLNLTPAEVVAMLSQNEEEVDCINKLKNDLGLIKPLESYNESDLKLVSNELMEFDILKYPQGIISLEKAIEKNINTGTLVYEEDVFELLKKIKISSIQISEQVQIVNYAYGYTRLKSCPDGNEDSTKLKLRGFNGKVFTTILDTEGILVQLDLIAIFNWLKENDFISNDIIVNNLQEAKKWFIENIHLDSITHFSTISGSNENKVTKIVYSLIHTIAHLMIISAGKHSGLSRDSISEIIFANACSFFIYPTSSEGVTLGSISGMFETDLKLFLEDTLKENEICTFDPICKTTQNGACVACTYLSEVNCTHFNKDLSRSYLYGGTIKINDVEIVVKKGFWK